MTSKAERLRYKRLARGRAMQAGPREPNGRLDRKWLAAESERSATSVAVEARMRLYGLPEAVARQGEAGTVIGRMRLSGALSQGQYEATLRYVKTVNAYRKAIGSTPDFDEPRDEGGGTGASYEEFCRTARTNFDAMQDSLRDLMIELRSPSPVAALDAFVMRDVYVASLEGDLKLAANRLVRHFGISDYPQDKKEDAA